MKVEIDIDDLEEVICSRFDNDSFNCKDMKEAVVNIAVGRCMDRLFWDKDHLIDKCVNNVIKENKDKIIDSVIDKVSKEILRKRAITEQMSKAKEIENVNKEWELYFLELIDKAIAKRFK